MCLSFVMLWLMVVKISCFHNNWMAKFMNGSDFTQWPMIYNSSHQTWDRSTLYLYSTYSDFTTTLRIHLSTFSIYAVKINLFVVNKMKLLKNTLLFLIDMTKIPPSPTTSLDGYPPYHPYTPFPIVAFSHDRCFLCRSKVTQVRLPPTPV